MKSTLMVLGFGLMLSTSVWAQEFRIKADIDAGTMNKNRLHFGIDEGAYKWFLEIYDTDSKKLIAQQYFESKDALFHLDQTVEKNSDHMNIRVVLRHHHGALNIWVPDDRAEIASLTVNSVTPMTGISETIASEKSSKRTLTRQSDADLIIVDGDKTTVKKLSSFTEEVQSVANFFAGQPMAISLERLEKKTYPVQSIANTNSIKNQTVQLGDSQKEHISVSGSLTTRQ